MELYLALLKALLNKENYSKYFNYINLEFLDKNFPELSRVFKTLPTLHSTEKEQYSTTDLKLAFYTCFPKADSFFYDKLFLDLDSVVCHDESVVGYLDEIRRRAIALDTAKLALKVAEGQGEWDEVQEKVSLINSDSNFDQSRHASRFVNESLEEIYATQVQQLGLRWRLNSLNKALGSLRKGDFGFLFARPETGKTTFLASEVTFMAEQANGPIIWFNNEEGGKKVKSRCYQAALGLSSEELYSDRAVNEARYKDLVKDRILIYNEASLTKNDVEEICKEYKPALVIFDQIDKIKGFKADRNDLELKELYSWAREIAKEYCPVIAVCQAGGSGEDKQWLTMNDVDSSKTSKQGEADWILGIGKVHEPGKEQIRYLHLSKNKLQGDPDSDSSLRHGRWTCYIKPEIARYCDFDSSGRVQ